MDDIWKRTYDALSQLERQIRERDPTTGTQHMGDASRIRLLDAIRRVQDDTGATKRLGELLLAHETRDGAIKELEASRG